MLRTLRPLLNAEFRYQRYLIQQGRVGLVWIVLAALLLIPAALASVHYMRLAWISVEDALGVAQRVVAFEGIWIASLLVGVISLYVVVTLITYALAANSILRERRSHTWDNLLLTNVPAWHILLGKWLASLRAVLGDHGLSIFLRVGLISLMALVLPALIAGAAPLSTAGLLVAWGWMLAAGALDAGLSAVLGLVSALPEGPTAVLVGGLLLGVRVSAAVGALFWSGWIVISPPVSALGLALLGCAAYMGIIGASLFFGWRQL
ncbi:MAG: hypothetical protein SNJ54_14650 [Anaerolineae bacterium]